MLPTGESAVFHDSSFFAQAAAPLELPTPSDVRAAQLRVVRNPRRPPPVLFPTLGLVVKYGRDTSIAEAQCISVPVPEVYGWCIDDGEVFVYMELVSGTPLDELWPSLRGEEHISVCHQLRDALKALRRLEQDPADAHVGDIARGPIQDYIFIHGGLAPAGPFSSVPQLHDHLALAKHCKNDPYYEHPYRYMLQDEARIVFTHGDLSFCNVLVSPASASDSTLRIAALLDWHQAGWMPDYWEAYKARWTHGDEWADRYLSHILDVTDDDHEEDHYWLQYIHYLGLA
ncbi:hypothetical protein EXIGLDRAFT_604553 [Exidia glandulosa HHB12029]|uniref:Aminoglycoside phosphotransferase domain-containing protein n=1 Tax=Exidia glandulosa HHB12029 TaxID=1314781 RepID=A0A165N5X4_EXIGL|nr:hypothetical protein EXIGLDRAFT_604553 [Exidia glandulosa HHB12029]